MGVAVISEAERRAFQCLHVLIPLDPLKEDGFRWKCLKCGKFLYRKNGIVAKPATRGAIGSQETK